MDTELIEGVKLTPLENIKVPGGNVLHALKKSEADFKEFGEAYFSYIEFKKVKAWKRHKKMTLSLVVPCGKIRFVIFDNRSQSKSDHKFNSIVLSPNNYFRLRVPPNLWMGFMGLSVKESLLLNLADMEHDPHEVDRVGEDEFYFNWSKE